ncbi:MAG: nucleotidyl transferase AbiEii/AbiGii toxin family protein [Hafnia sp.]
MKNMGPSVRMRLKEIATREKKDLVVLLDHYVIERLLYRISQTEISGLMVLKGAMLFSLWYEDPTRTTRDADFLSLINPNDPLLKQSLIDAMSLKMDDGIEFDTKSLEVLEIKKHNQQPGVRFKFYGYVHGARIRGQLDISYGDFVSEKIPTVGFPVILKDMPVPDIPVYPLPSVIAEKVQTMCAKGELNTRLKDFFDVSMILQNEKLDAKTIQKAMQGTFFQRQTDIPEGNIAAFSEEYAEKNAEGWKAFVRKNMAKTTLTFEQTQALISTFVTPIVNAMVNGEEYDACWNPQRKGWGPAEPQKEPLLVPSRRRANDVRYEP